MKNVADICIHIVDVCLFTRKIACASENIVKKHNENRKNDKWSNVRTTMWMEGEKKTKQKIVHVESNEQWIVCKRATVQTEDRHDD